MKYVLITGASSGIGYDACRYLLTRGWSVIGTVRSKTDQKRLQSDFPENFEAIILDVNDDSSIAEMKKYLEYKLGDIGLSALVNNAGIAKGGPLLHVDNDEFDLQMQSNLYSVFKISNALSNLLGAGFNNPLKAGRIINISSVSGLINTPMLGPYCVSKHALESLSDVYRRELAVYGIKVILIEPGPIKTPIWSKSVPPENPVLGTDFENMYEVFQKQVSKNEKKALAVEKMSILIHKVLVHPKPANRYIVSKSAFAIKMIKHLVPSRWMDKIFIRQLKNSMLFKQD
jgi:NAD(P)-dependent dehydrogenase (short-subunit alcohol dehydrogenase family)